MKLYLIFQEVNAGYDTYDSAVVCAENEEQARSINPGGSEELKEVMTNEELYFSAWCSSKDVKVEYIGDAKEGSEKGVICASFNSS